MSIKPEQLMKYVIRPTLRWMGHEFAGGGADVLMLATAAQESHCGKWLHQVGGPAMGIMQVEPYTHGLVVDWAKRAGHTRFVSKHSDDERLVYDLRYSVVIARMLYASWGIGLPGNGPDDHWQAYELWGTYKRRYNSAQGAATKAQFTRNWNEYVAPTLGANHG